MRTSEPIGVKPHARKARSERALPGATWAQHHAPTGTQRSPATINARPAPDEAVDGSNSSIECAGAGRECTVLHRNGNAQTVITRSA